MKKQKVALIAAISENRVLGKDNKLVWHLPADWENFKQVTAGKPFIMGRTSYESEDMLFSDSFNIVLTRQTNYSLPGKNKTAGSLAAAMEMLAAESEVFILGGGIVFEQSLALANYLYLTIVHQEFEGDSFFPEVDWSEWELVKSLRHEVDERHAHAFSLNEYRRM